MLCEFQWKLTTNSVILLFWAGLQKQHPGLLFAWKQRAVLKHTVCLPQEGFFCFETSSTVRSEQQSGSSFVVLFRGLKNRSWRRAIVSETLALLQPLFFLNSRTAERFLSEQQNNRARRRSSEHQNGRFAHSKNPKNGSFKKRCSFEQQNNRAVLQRTTERQVTTEQEEAAGNNRAVLGVLLCFRSEQQNKKKQQVTTERFLGFFCVSEEEEQQNKKQQVTTERFLGFFCVSETNNRTRRSSR